MSSREIVICIQGVGNEPKEQDDLAEQLKPYGFDIDLQPVDWATNNYEQRREKIVDHIIQLGGAHLMGLSGGGKVALDIFARHRNLVNRVITVSTKSTPYDLHPNTQAKYPNLVLSSNALAEGIHRIEGEMLARILCVHPIEDEIVNPEAAVLDGAQELVVPVKGHIEGITYAVTHGIELITDFMRQN